MVRAIVTFFLVAAFPPLSKASNASVPTEIRYVSGGGSLISGPIEIRAKGQRYLLAFTPECNGVEADTDGVDLSLYRPSENRCEHNLLAPGGNWHGPQPFMFLAWDLVHGPPSSLYGPERIFDLPRLGLRLHILLRQTDVTAGPAHTPEQSPEDKLRSLTIAVFTERYDSNPSPKH
jgi:hypothetical protein